MGRYKERRSVPPVIGEDALSAHIQGGLYDALHNDALSTEEKVAAMTALARLARSLCAHWRLNATRRRIFYRLCGLTSGGALPLELLGRVAEVEAGYAGLLAEIEEGDDDA